MTTADDDLSAIPGFSQPRSRLLDPPGPTLDDPENPQSMEPSSAETAELPETMPGPSQWFKRLRTPKLGHDGIPTRTLDSTGEPAKISVKETVKLVSGILVIMVGVAAMVIARADPSGRATLRKPSDHERENIARPVASILVRHADPALLNPDLTDLILAGSATVDYVSAGPLIVPVHVDPGVPAGVQDDLADNPDARPAAHPFDF